MQKENCLFKRLSILFNLLLIVLILQPALSRAALEISFSSQPTSLSIAEVGTWNVFLNNVIEYDNDGDPITSDLENGILNVTLPSDFTMTDPGTGSEIIGPPHTLTWENLNLAAGETLSFNFSAAPDRNAISGSQLVAALSGGTNPATNSEPVTILLPALTVTKLDSSGRSVTPIFKGETVDWTIAIENSGPGAVIRGVDLNETMGNALTFAGLISSSGHNLPASPETLDWQSGINWNTGPITAGTTALFTISATASGCDPAGHINLVSLNYRDLTDSSCLAQDLTTSASLALEIREPQLVITVTKPAEISYCPGGVNTATITLDNVGGDGPVENLSLEVSGWPSSWAINNVGNGASYSDGTFTIPDIPAGGSFAFTFDVDPSPGSCSPETSASLIFKPDYTNECGLIYGTQYLTPVVGPQTWTMEAADKPRISVVVSGPSSCLLGSEGLEYTVTATYSGPDEALPHTTDLNFDYNDNFVITTVSEPGADNGSVITWADLEFTTSQKIFTYTVNMNAPSEYCQTYSSYCHSGAVSSLSSDLEDCRGCDGTVLGGSVCTHIPDTNGTIVENSALTVLSSNPAEVCTNDIRLQTCYTFGAEAPDQWSSISLDNTVSSVNIVFAEIEAVTVGGSDVTSLLSSSFPLDLSVLEGQGLPSPSGEPQLCVTHRYSVDNAAGSYSSSSTLSLPSGFGSGCDTTPEYNVATSFSVSGSLMTLTAGGTPTFLKTCETREYYIAIDGSRILYDASVTLDTDNNYIYLNTVSFTDIVDAAGVPISMFLPVDNGDGSYTWDFDTDIRPQGRITFTMQHDCNTDNKTWSASGRYHNSCENEASDSWRYAADSAGTTLILDGNPTLHLVPTQIFAYTPYPQFTLYVVNGGSGPLYNATVNLIFDTDIEYLTAAPGSGSNAPDNINVTDTRNVVFTYNEIAPGAREILEVTGKVSGCSNLDIMANLSWGCGGQACDTSSKTSTVLLPASEVLVVSHSGESLDYCDDRDADFLVTVRNTGKSEAYNLIIEELLPPGLTYVAGSVAASHSGGHGSLTGDPIVTTVSEAGGQRISFDFSSVLPLNSDNDPSLKVGSDLIVTFAVEMVDCDAVSAYVAGSKQASATARFDRPCAYFAGSAASLSPALAFATLVADPQISTQIQARNITLNGESGTWSSSQVAAADGDVVEWQVTYTNTGNYPAKDVTISGSEPVDVSLTSFLATGDRITQTAFFGSDANLQNIGDLDPGETFSVIFRGTVSSSVCPDPNPTRTVSATAAWGCCVSPAAESSNDSLNLYTQPRFDTGGQVDISTPRWYFGGGQVTVTLTNVGATALNDASGGITVELPAGFVFDSGRPCTVTATNTPANASHVNLSCGSPSGRILVWNADLIDKVFPGETITISFSAVNDGNVYVDLTADNDILDLDVPIPGLNIPVGFNFHDSCANPYSVSDSVTVDPRQPDIDITVTPLTQSVPVGGTAEWTITLVNEGREAAENIVLTSVFGDAFSDFVIISGATPTWIGNTATWSIDGPINRNETWEVTLQATVGIGNVIQNLTVEGSYIDDLDRTIGLYTHDETAAAVSGFEIEKSVSKATANVGSLLEYDLTAVFSSTELYQDVSLVDTLPPRVTVVDVVAAGDNDLVAGAYAVAGDSASGQTITWSPADFDGTKNFHYTLTVRIDNHAENHGGSEATILENNFKTDFSLDLDGDSIADVDFSESADPVSTTVTEPGIDLVSKTMAPKTDLVAGDSTTVTLTFKNIGDGPAYNLEISDLINDTDNDGDVDNDDVTVYDCASISQISVPTGYTLNAEGSAPACRVTLKSNGDQALDANGELSVSFALTLADSALLGSTFTNTANASAWSLPPSDGETENVTFDRETTDNAGDSLTTAGITAAANNKTLTATSETSTSGSWMAIGEVVDYALTFAFPPGTTAGVTLIDELPDGLAYMANSAQLARGSSAVTATLNPGNINNSASTVNVTLNPVGDELQLALGNVTNSGSGNASLTLTLSCLVENIATNNQGTGLVNQGRIDWENAAGVSQSSSGGEFTVTVAEPTPTITKSASPTTAEAGERITFTLAFANNGTQTGAFDWTFSDPLPATYDNPGNIIITTGSTGAVVAASFTDTTLNGTIDHLDPGDSITVSYQADLKADLAYASSHTNTASFTTTSLPGTGLKTPGATGDEDGERSGSGVAANDLNSSDNASVSISVPTLTKEVDGTKSYYAIGEEVSYRLRVGIPVGTTTNLNLEDLLPVGLSYVDGSQSVSLPGNFTAANNPALFAWDANSRKLTWTFGNSSQSVSAGELVITYRALVRNILSNQDGTNLTNEAELYYGDGLSANPAETSLTVGEANLFIEKTPQTSAAGLDAGDDIRYWVDILNNGHTTACRVNWQDILPYIAADNGLGNICNPSLTIIAGEVYQNGTTTLPTVADLIISTTNSHNDTIALPLLEVAPGGQLQVEFTAALLPSVIAGSTLVNRTQASYNSLVDGGGRDGSSSGSDDDNNSDLNNYNESASHTITVAADLAIVKTLPAGTDHFTIGEDFTYRLRAWMIEGITPQVEVHDLLPEGLTYISHQILTPATGTPTFGNPGYNTRLGSGQDFYLALGDVSNLADDPADNSNDYFDTEITVRVDNILANQNQTQLLNGEETAGSAVYIVWGGGDNVYYDYDGTAAGRQGLPITITEPELTLSKTVAPATQALGDIVTFTIKAEHDSGSSSDAYDLLINDLLPDGLTYLDSSLPEDSVLVVGQNLEFNKASLTRAAPDSGIWQFTYRARIELDTVVGQSLVNQAALGWSSRPDADGSLESGRNASDCPAGPNNYCSSDDIAVIPAISAFIEAQKSVSLVVDDGIAEPGDTLTYTILLNSPDQDVSNVIFTDTVPANTSYVNSSLNTTHGSVDESGDPNLVVEVGELAAGETVTISFQVTIANLTPAGTTISNQGLVDSDETVPEPTDADGIDANGDQPTEIMVGGAPAEALLYCSKFVEWEADIDDNGVISPGDIMTYWVIFENEGSQNLTGVNFSDTIPAGLIYNSDSDSSDGTLIISGDTVSLSGMSVETGNFGYIWFDVVIADPLPGGSEQSFSNQGSASSDQTQTLISDGNGDPSDGYQPTIFTAVDDIAGTPQLDIEKRWHLQTDFNGNGLVNPYDQITYTILLSNTGSAEAENVRLQDNLPAETTLVNGSVNSSQGVVVSQAPLNVNLGNLAPGENATVSLTVTIDSGYADGLVISNQAVAAADNLAADESSDDNGLDADGKNSTLTPIYDAAGDGDDIIDTSQPSGLIKTLLLSSEADSLGAELLIGELSTYRITVKFPAGTTRHATITDQLPTGLSYIAGSALLSRNYAQGLNSSVNPGTINLAPSGVQVPLEDGSEIIISGQDVTLFLGDIISSDEGIQASYSLDIDVVVENSSANQAGETRLNQGHFSYWDNLSRERSLTPAVHLATITEADIEIEKEALPISISTSGGTAAFTVTVSNPNAANMATAYDLLISDDLPANFSNLEVVSISPAGGVSGVTDNSNSDELSVTIATFPVDGSLTVIYTADLAALAEGSLVSNTARVTWTSLPGAYGSAGNRPETTDDEPGAIRGERISSQAAPNDYLDLDSVTVVVGDIAINKSISSGNGTYAVGDFVSYQVELSGNWAGGYNSRLEDILPAGLSYVEGSLILTSSEDVVVENSTPPVAREPNLPSAGAETVTFSLGDILNSSPGTTQWVRLSYQARVDNLLSVQQGVILENEARFVVDDAETGGSTWTFSDNSAINIGEPHLSLSKSITSSYSGLDAGDRVDFSVTAINDGLTTAYDVLFSDLLPAALENITNLNVLSSSGGASTPLLSSDSSSWWSSSFDLPSGGRVEIGFTIELAATVESGDLIQNQITATFSSQDGIITGERDGSSPDSQQDDDNLLNNYNTSAKAPTIVVADPVQIDKRFYPTVEKTAYSIGEEVGYRIKVDLFEGLVSDLVVVDTLPDNLTFKAALVSAGHSGITYSYNNPDGVDISGQQLSFSFGQVTNPANASQSDDFLVIDITAVIDNLNVNQAGEVLTNNCYLSFTAASGLESRYFDSDIDEAGVQGLDLTISEPALRLEKSVTPAQQSLGDRVQFTLTLGHLAESSANAYDFEIVDHLPAGLTYIPGSGYPEPEISGNQLTFNLAALTLADLEFSIIYEAYVDLDAPVDSLLENRARLIYSSIPDADGTLLGGRNGSDCDAPETLNDYCLSDVATVTPLAASSLDAQKTVVIFNDVDSSGSLSVGDILEYEVTLTNLGSLLSNVIFQDPIPLFTTYVPGSIQVDNLTMSDADDGDAARFSDSEGARITVAFASLPEAGVVVVNFQVRVDDITPSGIVIANQGLVDSDQTVPEPTDADGIDENGDQPTEITVNATPVPGLRVEKQVALTLDLVAPFSSTINVGDQVTYTFTVINSGEVDLHNVSVNDIMPDGLTIVAVSNCDWTPPESAISALFPVLNAGQSQIMAVTATVSSLGSETAVFAEFVNQGLAAADELEENVLTDGNRNRGDGFQETSFTAVAAGQEGHPELQLEKSYALIGDKNKDGLVNPGEVIRYILTVSNQGSAPATGVMVTDFLPVELFIAPGAVHSSQGVVVSESPEVSINLGTLEPGASALVFIEPILVLESVAHGTVISNQAQALDAEGENILSDDPADASGDEDPTVFSVSATHRMLPPQFEKTTTGVFSEAEMTIIEWQLKISNQDNHRSMQVMVTDPLPDTLSFVEASLSCEALNESYTFSCSYDLDSHAVIWEGVVASDFNDVDEALTENEIVITFRTIVDMEVESVGNQAFAYWDENGNDLIGDEIVAGQQAVPSDDPETDIVMDATLWYRYGIPTLSEIGFVMLFIILSLLSVRLARRR